MHVGSGQWRLCPAFDINPFPDKQQELKTWLTEESGPVSSIEEVVHTADYFRLDHAQALNILAEVCHAIKNWRTVAMSPAVGMRAEELNDFASAFEHPQMKKAALLINR